MSNKQKIFGVTGWKNSGKTRMVAALVEELASRGMNVSTIKHAHHSFDVDQEGTDSFKHRKAGAKEVMLVSRNRWALMHELDGEDEPPLEAILEKLGPCDLVIIEGYKREGHPKLEMMRGETKRDSPLWPDDPSIAAIVSDERQENCTLPQFRHDDVKTIADFVLSCVERTEIHAAE